MKNFSPYECLFYYIDLYIYLIIFFLSFCLYVYLYMSVYLSIVSFFLLLSPYFSRKFRVHFFAQFCIIFFLNFFAKPIDAKFREKSKNVRIFREQTKCDIFGKNCKLFTKRFSFFAEKQQS